jgi:hypothetical protein
MKEIKDMEGVIVVEVDIEVDEMVEEDVGISHGF